MAFCTYPLAQAGGSGGAQPPQGISIICSVSPLSEAISHRSAVKVNSRSSLVVSDGFLKMFGNFPKIIDIFPDKGASWVRLTLGSVMTYGDVFLKFEAVF